jgi:hypothetical protein
MSDLRLKSRDGALTGYGDNPTILSEAPVPVNAFMIAIKPILAMH